MRKRCSNCGLPSYQGAREEIVEHTREAMARDRRTDWRWTPPECLAELKECSMKKMTT